MDDRVVNQWAEPSINSGNATFIQIKEFQLAAIHMVYIKRVEGPPGKLSIWLLKLVPCGYQEHCRDS